MSVNKIFMVYSNWLFTYEMQWKWSNYFITGNIEEVPASFK